MNTIVTYRDFLNKLKAIELSDDTPVVIEVGEMVKLFSAPEVVRGKGLRFTNPDRIGRMKETAKGAEGEKIIIIRPAKG